MTFDPEKANKYSEFRENYNETETEILDALTRTGLQDLEVLDFGSGDGRFSEKLIGAGAKNVMGIDNSKAMVALAKERHKQETNINFVVADGSSLPLPDGQFDRVFSNFVIHYFPNATLVFREISRVLKNEGYFVGTFNICTVSEGNDHLFNTSMPIKLGQGGNSVIVENLIKSETEIRSAMEAVGFSILEFRELSHPNATIDDSYAEKDKVNKKVILCVAKKYYLKIYQLGKS